MVERSNALKTSGTILGKRGRQVAKNDTFSINSILTDSFEGKRGQ